MSEYMYLALSAVVFIVGLIIGILLLRRSLKEQVEYEQKLRQYGPSTQPPDQPAPPPYPAPGPAYPSPPQGPAYPSPPQGPAYPSPPQGPASPSPPQGPAYPSPPQGPASPTPPPPGPAANPAETEAKSKVESTKQLVDQMKGEGMDVSSAEKLLQLATSCLYSGDFDRANKYASKASKVSKDIRERAQVERQVVSAPNAPAAATEDPQQKEVVGLISNVQSRIATVKEESVEKSEIENLLRLATSFVRSKSFGKALRYARQAEEKANALVK